MNYIIDAIYQFRELGGLPTKDGRHIKNGRFFRSANLCGATDRDLKTIEDLGITTVFDLRTPSEAAAAPDRKGNFVNLNIPAFLDTQNKNKRFRDKQAGEHFFQELDEANYHFMHHLYITSYYEMPYNRTCFGEIFKALNEHQSILFHCAGGKDRTGVAAMLISLALGCDYETCRDNYLLHNEITKKINEDAYQKAAQNGFSPYGMKAYKFCMEACEDFFDVAYGSIFATYPSIEEFLWGEYQITRAQIEDWRAFYLE